MYNIEFEKSLETLRNALQSVKTDIDFSGFELVIKDVERISEAGKKLTETFNVNLRNIHNSISKFNKDFQEKVRDLNLDKLSTIRQDFVKNTGIEESKICYFEPMPNYWNKCTYINTDYDDGFHICLN